MKPFLYDSNWINGDCTSIDDIVKMFEYQMRGQNSIDSVDAFLDRSKSSKASEHDSFGTRREHTSNYTLRMFLEEQGVLNEFLELADSIIIN